MKDDAGCVEERLQPMESNIVRPSCSSILPDVTEPIFLQRRELKALVQGAIPEDRLTLLCPYFFLHPPSCVYCANTSLFRNCQPSLRPLLSGDSHT